jgi:cytoskeletal protein CcmA (bactofilin family)
MAFIDEGCEIEGDYKFSGTVMLNCTFRGNIESTGTLVIGEKAVINAGIASAVVRVSGEINGRLVASERVELESKARVVGDIETPVLVIEQGAVFEGQCRMPSVQVRALEPVMPRQLSVVSAER